MTKIAFPKLSEMTHSRSRSLQNPQKRQTKVKILQNMSEKENQTNVKNPLSPLTSMLLRAGYG